MDDTEDDDTRYPQKHHQSAYNSSTRSRFTNRNPPFPTNNNSNYRNDDNENEYEDDGFDEEEEEEEEENRGYEDEGDEEYDDGSGYQRPNGEPERRQKKRRMDNSVPNYEYAPRATPKMTFSARNSPADWSEHGTSVLLEKWGDRYLQLGRKSLRSEDWVEVSEKVSEALKIERSDLQCRNRLDTLKKKYKKEKTKLEELGGGYSSKWMFFKNMDMLLNSPPSRQQCGLACGLDSGEYVFMNPKVYLNRSNGLDEMRDSPGESESSETDDDDSDGLPPKRKGFGDDEGDDDDGSSFRLLADSIEKFGEIYEKIESSKRKQMMELEKMRMDFQRDLEMQKKQILERAQAEIAKIQEGDDEDTDGSAENLSG